MSDVPIDTESPQTKNLLRLLEIMARLRAPDGGCPWDLEQSFATIAPHTIEEAYEVADAIQKDDMAGLLDELGDLLFQVVFHARMAQEAGLFAFDDVARAIADKMVRRHPHVFGDAMVDSAAAQTAAWEEQKAIERGDQKSALDGVAVGLPALTRALKLQKRAARVGFDWPSVTGVFDKIEEEVIEIKRELEESTDQHQDRLEDEVGDLLFAVTNLARHLNVEPETALRRANTKFTGRFQSMERRLTAEGAHLEETSLEQKEKEWQLVKRGG